MMDHEKEIYSRPKKEWFLSTKEKRATAKVRCRHICGMFCFRIFSYFSTCMPDNYIERINGLFLIDMQVLTLGSIF